MLLDTIKSELCGMPHDEQNKFLSEVINVITISRKTERAALAKKMDDISKAERDLDKEIIRVINKSEEDKKSHKIPAQTVEIQ